MDDDTRINELVRIWKEAEKHLHELMIRKIKKHTWPTGSLCEGPRTGWWSGFTWSCHMRFTWLQPWTFSRLRSSGCWRGRDCYCSLRAPSKVSETMMFNLWIYILCYGPFVCTCLTFPCHPMTHVNQHHSHWHGCSIDVAVIETSMSTTIHADQVR